MKKILYSFILSFFIWIVYSNEHISTSYYSVSSDKIIKPIKIVQISDVHDSKKTKSIINKTKKEKPDCIVITGDLIDIQESGMYNLIKRLTNIAPVYYVSGNHEAVNPRYKKILENINKTGAVVLNQRTVHINDISISGIEDSSRKNPVTAMNELSLDDHYNILLAHHPEKINIYAEKGFDLVLSGHAHGGQIIIPFLGGLYSPNQGILPKYYKGIYTKENTKLIVCAGIGGPKPRFNNPPEICVIKLSNE